MGKGVIFSSFFSIGANWLSKFLGLISTVLLARLLTPDDFGTVAIVMLVIYFFDLFAANGTKSYLLTLSRVQDEDLNCALTINVLTRIIVAFFLLVMSPFFADFFKSQDLIYPLALSSLILVIGSFENPKLNILRRDMNYSKIFKISVLAKFISFVVTLVLAYSIKSYWALIIGSLAFYLSNTILSYVIVPYRPKFDLSRIREQWNFTKWIYFNSFISYARSKADIFVISKFYSVSDVGVFSLAKELSMLVYEQIALPLCDIIVASVRNSQNKVETVENYFSVLLSILLPISTFIFLYADVIISLFLGEQWTSSSNVLKCIAYLGATSGLIAYFYAVLNAIKKVKERFYYDSIASLFIVVAIFLFTGNNLEFFALVLTIISIFYLIGFLIVCRYFMEISIKRLLVSSIPVVLGTGIIFYGDYLASKYIILSNSLIYFILKFLLLACSFVLVFLVSAYLLSYFNKSLLFVVVQFENLIKKCLR